MGAAEYDGVDLRVAPEQFVDVLPNEVVGTGRLVFHVLDEGRPQWAGLTGDLNVGVQFLDFDVVSARADGAGRGHDADVACASDVSDTLGRGTHHAQYAAGGVDEGKVALLYGAQGLGRGGIAG